MAYIGQGIKQGTFAVLDTSGNTYNGSNTTFSLGTQVGSAAQLLVSHDGVIQKAGTDYTLATGGTQITFSTAPASGASIFIVEISGAVGGPLNSDLNGTELILDVDADTSITADTDDQIDIRIAGADDFTITANKFDALAGSNIHVSGDADADDITGDSAQGRLALGAGQDLNLYHGGTNSYIVNDTGNLVINTGASDADIVFSGNDGGSAITALTIDMSTGGRLEVNGIKSSGGNTTIFNEDGGNSDFRVESSGNANAIFLDNGNEQVLIGGTVDAGNLSGASSGSQFAYELGGFGCFARSGNPALRINRTNGDGDVMTFASAGGVEGTISISGSTTSYGAFCGTHWSRLADNSKSTILRGTVMESIATMVNWYQVEFEVDELDDEKNVKGKIKTKRAIDLPDGGKIGDDFKYTYKAVEYTGKIIKEDNERLPMCKISDTADSKAVYGVFMAWDDDDDGTTGVNDMNVASLGAFVVRIHKDETVAIGDYLQSKGDGTAKKQADDILRASTIAKVTSTEKTHTYDDGSYCVPCTLHCG